MALDQTFSMLDISGSGLSAERVRMNVVAQNIANANTQSTPEGGPYRKKEVVFESVLQESTGSARRRGAGVKVAGIVTSKEPLKKVYDPGNPAADANGFVTMPNVNVVTEMVDMVSASRAYGANLAVVNASKDMINRSLDIIRR